MSQPKGQIADMNIPSRLRILEVLRQGEMSVSEICGLTGLKQPNVSNHLSALLRARLVKRRRAGRRVLYRSGSAKTRDELRLLAPLICDRFLTALRNHDRSAAIVTIDESLEMGMDWRAIYTDILAPALERIGVFWEEGEISVAEEHAATTITQEAMSRVRPDPNPSPGAPCAVVGCVEGNLHDIGARMAADFLSLAGWKVLFLGADCPVRDFAEMVAAEQPDLVGISIARAGCEEPAARLVKSIGRMMQEAAPRIIAGGRAVTHDLQTATRIGADAGVSGAADVVSKADALIGRQSGSRAAERSPWRVR